MILRAAPESDSIPWAEYDDWRLRVDDMANGLWSILPRGEKEPIQLRAEDLSSKSSLRKALLRKGAYFLTDDDAHDLFGSRKYDFQAMAWLVSESKKNAKASGGAA